MDGNDVPGMVGGTVSGLVEPGIGSIVMPPLIARNQPLAMGFLTRSGDQVAVVPGWGNFKRLAMPESWPTAAVFGGLRGPSEGVYDPSPEKIPSGYAVALFEELVAGADRTLHWFTDPANWRTSAGVFDLEERQIAWSSFLFGLRALDSVGQTWASDEGLWAAFRALGTLQGIWEGNHAGSVSLDDLVSPRTYCHACDQRYQDRVSPPVDDPGGGTVPDGASPIL